MKILLGDLNLKFGREDILKPTIGNESLRETNNDNWVRVVNFATFSLSTWRYNPEDSHLHAHRRENLKSN
jgi:hypothetical protein